MKLPRREFLHLTVGAAALPAVSSIARAQAYPSRPVRLIVGYPPGTTTDILARLMSQWLSERLGQPFVIENRPGASGNIATESVARAPADGHTLLLIAAPNVINATLYEKLNFDLMRDIAAVSGVTRAPLVLEVSPSFAARTVPELIENAKTNPGKIATRQCATAISPCSMLHDELLLYTHSSGSGLTDTKATWLASCARQDEVQERGLQRSQSAPRG